MVFRCCFTLLCRTGLETLTERTHAMNMNSFLNPENPVMEFLRKLSDIVILNAIFILSCIPILTIGAAVTSLYTVTFQIAKLEDPHIWQAFWSAFRRNFRQSTLIWVICFAVIALLCLDFLFLQAQSSPFAAYVQMAIWMVTFLFASVIHYIFPVVSHFICTTGQYWKNALLMCLAHFPYTLLFLLIDGLIVYGCLYSVQTLGMVFMLGLICGFSCIALGKSFLFLRIFRIYDPKPESEQKE